MIPDSARRDLISALNAAHAAGRSWRNIARDFPGVTPSALCRISKGEWMPKDKRILRALGLTKLDEATRYERQFKRTFTRLLKELRG